MGVLRRCIIVNAYDREEWREGSCCFIVHGYASGRSGSTVILVRLRIEYQQCIIASRTVGQSLATIWASTCFEKLSIASFNGLENVDRS